MRRIMTLLVLVSIILPLAAQEQNKVTYEELRAGMSSSSTDIMQAVEDYKSASADLREAKSNLHPQITYSLAGSYVYNHQVMDLDMTDIKKEISGMNMEIYNQTIPLAPLASQINDNISYPIDISDPYLNASVSLIQPIYTWGKLTSSIDMYEEIEAARALQIGDTEARLDATLKAYLSSLYYLRQVSERLEGMKEDTDQLVQLAKDSSEAGLILSQDAAQTRVSARQIDMTLTQVRTQMDTILSQIEVMTGYGNLTADMIDYTPDEDGMRALAQADRTMLEAMATSAGQNSMQMLTHMINATQAAKKAADRSMYVVPDIALSVSANYTAPLTSSFIDNSSWSVTVAVALQGTIWDGGKNLSARDKAESAASSAEISRKEAVNTIKTTLAQNFAAMDLALAQIDYQSANIEMLDSQLELEKTRYEYGAASRRDVLEKQLECAQAEIERLNAFISLAGSAYTVEYLTGFSS